MQPKLSTYFKMLCYASQLRFSRCSPHFFIYMLNNYFRMKTLEKTFKLEAIPSALIQTLPKIGNVDVNNVIIVNQKYLNDCNINTKFVKLYQNKILKRICFVIGMENLDQDVVYLSNNLKFNLNDASDVQLRRALVNFAPEVDLSLVNPCIDIKHETVQKLLKNYFEVPKLIRENDVITINIRQYHPEFFFTSTKLGLSDVHFKCNQVLLDGDQISKRTVLCVYGETTLKLSPNVQTYIAPISRKVFEFSNGDAKFESNLIDLCPYGLESYVESLKKSITPFLSKNSLKLKPCFLLQGKKGSGKCEMVASLTSNLGLHLFETSSREITSSTYAQSEIKLSNVFTKAKLCSPCILVINNFENFGKNNEGEYDERILSFFKTQLNNLFTDNKFPVILICVSNSKEIPPSMLRTFLEIFEVNVPDNSQRVRMLEWILETQRLPFDANLEEISNKSRGFLFEDLKALVYHARQKKSYGELQDDDFNYAVDLMQSNYSRSMGAPKIPKVQWSDIGGLSDVKKEIIKTVDLHMKSPAFFVQSGLKCSGILLYGPPGTGKTLLAKAVATECNLCFLSVKGPELLNMYVGQSEKNIRDVFDKAREASPCIIFFDELDSLAPNRGASGDSGGVMDRVVSQLLAEMDGLNQQSSIFIIGATNRPDLIDQALLRPGRFDKLLYVGPCTDPDSKLSVLTALTRKFNLADGTNLSDVIDFCPKNLTGADFYGLAYHAWKSAVRKVIEKIENGEANEVTHKDIVVTLDDFKKSLEDLKPSITEKDLAYFRKLEQQFSVKDSKKLPKTTR